MFFNIGWRYYEAAIRILPGNKLSNVRNPPRSFHFQIPRLYVQYSTVDEFMYDAFIIFQQAKYVSWCKKKVHISFL